MKYVRLERINAELRNQIADVIDNQLRDPQINAMICVHSVDITPDLAYARVYISSIGETPQNEVLARIKGAGGFIRGAVAKKIKLRIMPRLEFYLDNSEEYGKKIDDILSHITYATKEEDE